MNSMMGRTATGFGVLMFGVGLVFIGISSGLDEAHGMFFRVLVGIGATVVGVIAVRSSAQLLGGGKPSESRKRELRRKDRESAASAAE
jgi:hypothetical protein